MVWLRGFSKLSPASWSTAFQFQYGVIKSVLHVQLEGTLLKFQFQYGVIKRLAVCSTASVHINFNSSMVWLRENRRISFRKFKKLFQFQYGVIKSW